MLFVMFSDHVQRWLPALVYPSKLRSIRGFQSFIRSPGFEVYQDQSSQSSTMFLIACGYPCCSEAIAIFGDLGNQWTFLIMNYRLYDIEILICWWNLGFMTNKIDSRALSEFMLMTSNLIAVPGEGGVTLAWMGWCRWGLQTITLFWCKTKFAGLFRYPV